MRVKYRDELWEWNTGLLWELSTAMNYESELPDVLWELSTAMNYASEVPRQIMWVKYRDEFSELKTATYYEG